METTKGTLKIEDYGKYYSAEVWCFNCHDKQHIYIIKGTPARNIKKECSRCGCVIDMKSGASAT